MFELNKKVQCITYFLNGCVILNPHIKCESLNVKKNQQFDFVILSDNRKAQIEYEGCGCEIVEMEIIITVELTHVWS